MVLVLYKTGDEFAYIKTENIDLMQKRIEINMWFVVYVWELGRDPGGVNCMILI